MNKEFDILVIDDEQVIIDAVLKICSAEGYKVDSSLDAKDALKKIESNRYKIFLCDIMMPDIGGFEFLDEINKRKLNSYLIMTTGFSTVENAVKSLYNGAIDFIPKPFTVDELVSSIYRGIKYYEIQNAIKLSKNKSNDESIFYVPCPAKYYRLGYSSWAYEDQTGSILIGIMDLFLKTIDSIFEIELLKIDDEILQGNSCMQIKSEKDEMIHQVLAPVSGRILERNESVINEMSIVEKDPYFKGWIYRVIPSDSEYELKQLIPCSSDRI